MKIENAQIIQNKLDKMKNQLDEMKVKVDNLQMLDEFITGLKAIDNLEIRNNYNYLSLQDSTTYELIGKELIKILELKKEALEKEIDGFTLDALLPKDKNYLGVKFITVPKINGVVDDEFFYYKINNSDEISVTISWFQKGKLNCYVGDYYTKEICERNFNSGIWIKV